MKGFNLMPIIIAVAAIAMLAGTAPAQYWFQAGATTSENATFNTGVSVSIQTIYPQYPTSGSFGYWIGESLANNAFIQVGYEIPNETGYYPANCTQSGCAGKTLIAEGYPTWFWEYFPKGDNSSVFYGSVGPNDSVGANGTFNTYSFKAFGDTWNIYINGKEIGSVNLGTSNSGNNVPSALAEDAGTEINTAYMHPVEFRNLSYYKNGVLELSGSGYSYLGYGVGSLTSLKNLYGIAEVKPYVNYFEVGSGLPQPGNLTKLWSFGYYLKINSQYGNQASYKYSAYSNVNMSEPKYIYINNATREKFLRWQGAGAYSYSGPSNETTIFLGSNTTETAVWETQYLIRMNNPYNMSFGSGWYSENSTAFLGVRDKIFNISNTQRELFAGFSNGITYPNFSLVVKSPENITATWENQYFVNATSQVGSATGSGWYNENSTATISLKNLSQEINSSEMLEFYSWSNGQKNSTVSVNVTGNLTLTAEFVKAFKENLIALNVNGTVIDYNAISVNGVEYYNKTLFLPEGTNEINYVLYKNMQITPTAKTVMVYGPGTMNVTIPVYNIKINATDIFGRPISAKVSVKFENNTEENLTLNNSGAFTLYNVPYGNLTGEISYSGFKEKISSTYGSPIRISMVTMNLIILIIAIILLVASFWFAVQFVHAHK